MPGIPLLLSGLPWSSWLIPGAVGPSSHSALHFFPGQILTTFPLQAMTICSCEGSPIGSSWLWPEQAPGRPGHFLQLAPHLADLLSSVFLLPMWSYIPVCQSSHKGFPACRTEEEAVGPLLSVLLGGCPAVCTQLKQCWVQRL